MFGLLFEGLQQLPRLRIIRPQFQRAGGGGARLRQPVQPRQDGGAGVGNARVAGGGGFRPRQRVQGAGQILLRRQGQAEVAPGVGVAWIQARGLPQFRDGLRRIPGVIEGQREAVVILRLARFGNTRFGERIHAGPRKTPPSAIVRPAGRR